MSANEADGMRERDEIVFPPDWTVVKPSNEAALLFWWFVQAILALVGYGVARYFGVL